MVYGVEGTGKGMDRKLCVEDAGEELVSKSTQSTAD